MNISKLLLLAGLVLVSGCASSPRSESVSSHGLASMATDQGPMAVDRTETSTQPATSAAFPPEILYQLLVAEVAGQRGQLDLAVANYLAAAKASRDINIVRRATRLAVFAQALKQGLEAGRLWLTLEPSSVEALKMVAPLLLAFGHESEAIAHFQRLIELSASAPDQGLMQIAGQLSRESNHEAAMSVMDALLVDRQDDAYAWLAKGQLAMRQQAGESALAAVGQALKLRPHWAPAVVLRAQALYAQGEKQAALAFMAKEREGALAEDEGVGLTYARMLADAGKLEEALREFELLTQQQPENASLHYAAGVLALQFQMLDQAEAHFKKTLSLRHRTQEVIYQLGRIYELREDAIQAIRFYRAVQSDDLYFDAQMRIGNLLVKAEGLDAAIAHLRSVRINNEGEKTRLSLLQGEWLREAGRLREALDFYSEKLREMPEEASLHYARALVAESLDELELAEQDLVYIIERDPENSQALNALGYTLADRTSRYMEALGYIERALAIEPDDGVILDSMGWVQYRLGNLAKAEEYLRRAMALIDDPEVAAHLGEVLWMQDQQEAARKIWESYLEQFPGHEALLEVMQRFGL